MANRRIIGAILAVAALAGCGGDSSTNTTTPTAQSEQLAPSDLLDKMEAAMARYPTFRMELRDNGRLLYTGDFDIGPPFRAAMTIGPPDDAEVVIVRNQGFARPLDPPNAKWTTFPQTAMAEIEATSDLKSLFAPLRAGTVRVEQAGSVVRDGKRLDRTDWLVDYRKAATASGDPIQENVPDQITYRILLDEEFLMREVEFATITARTTRWGEPLDITLPPKSQIE